MDNSAERIKQEWIRKNVKFWSFTDGCGSLSDAQTLNLIRRSVWLMVWVRLYWKACHG